MKMEIRQYGNLSTAIIMEPENPMEEIELLGLEEILVVNQTWKGKPLWTYRAVLSTEPVADSRRRGCGGAHSLGDYYEE